MAGHQIMPYATVVPRAAPAVILKRAQQGEPATMEEPAKHNVEPTVGRNFNESLGTGCAFGSRRVAEGETGGVTDCDTDAGCTAEASIGLANEDDADCLGRSVC